MLLCRWNYTVNFSMNFVLFLFFFFFPNTIFVKSVAHFTENFLSKGIYIHIIDG